MDPLVGAAVVTQLGVVVVTVLNNVKIGRQGRALGTENGKGPALPLLEKIDDKIDDLSARHDALVANMRVWRAKHLTEHHDLGG